MGSYLMLFRSVLILLFIEATTCNSDQINRDACQTFIAAKNVKDLIEVKKKLIPHCPCLKQKIDLDYSFEKVGDCYRSWFFENGVKQMCCYSSNGHLLTGAPHGGYMMFEDQWRNMADIKRSCCLDDYTCQLFYNINPSDDCSSYKPPITVTSLGDPNIQTIDGHKFDFNGHGEYVFLKTSDLEIQVRLGYVTPGNSDNTLFEAFAIFDRTSGETFEVYFNRSTKKLSVYKNGTVICNSTGVAHPKPCEPPKKNHCMVLTDDTMIVIIGCGVQSLARQIVFTPGEFMDVSMKPQTAINSMNITGLAGRQRDGKYIFRNGTEIDTNSTRILFDYGESWLLVNESESHFNYSLTGGNFTFYNEPHSRPTFLEDLVGNLTALFQGYPGANISLFNETCRNYWDNRPNEECLLTIARTKQFQLGVTVMETVNEEHLKWEILHNKSPYFLGNMTDNITAVYKQDANITIDLKQYVLDDQPVDTLSFNVETKLPKEEFSLVNGVFVWNVGTGLRYSDTSIRFFVTDRLNASASHDVKINYCGCNDPSECDFEQKNTNSSSVVTKAGCKCPILFSGLYCEKEIDPCASFTCYQNKCNKSFDSSSESWPCAPCPKGRKVKMFHDKQTCTDIDECVEGYSGRDKCEHNCTNTYGSFICSCKNGGYKLNYNKYSCDDIDECEQKTAHCKEVNTYCQNTLGSYMCLCSPGYENSTGSCKKIEGQKYVGSMDIVIVMTQEKAERLNETINTEENRQTFQKILDKGFIGTQGYQSVEVLSIMITSTSRFRGDAEMRKYNLKVDYVVTWAKNETVDGTKSTALWTSFQSSGHNKTLTLENVPIDLNTAILNVKSGNTSGICSFPNLINCDISSMRCVDVPGSFKCECRHGFVSRGSNVYCADVDECKDTNYHNCSGHGTCINRHGGFTCDCDEGFSLNDTDEWYPTCDDIDECKSPEKYTCYQGYCSNTIGGWDCTCNETGFIRNKIGTGFICSDIDECSNGSYICKDGNCKNSVGDWSCTCEPGYMIEIVSATNVTCKDINECDRFKANETGEERCVHGACENKPGSWACNCPRNRIRQNVGNSSYAVYRCQGDYQYIGQLTLLWITSNVSNKSVEIFLNKTITELFREKYNGSITLPKGQTSMRDIFLSLEYLNATYQDLGGAVKTNASYVLHLGEKVTSEWVNEIQSKIFNQTKQFTNADGGQIIVIASTILNDVDECLSAMNKCTGSEICVNSIGSYLCVCAPGYSREVNNVSCVHSGKLTLEDAVDVKCSVSNWEVSINMDVLRSLYPTVSQGAIYMGQIQCQGHLENSTLTFKYSLEACKTKEIASGVTKIYSNKLFYAVFDPIHPFLIRRHIWTFAIECDVIKAGTGTSHLHHGIENHHSTFVNRYNVTVELFKDQNFQYPLSEGRKTVHVGDDVYVKVSTSIPDWNTKMRLHTCFTNSNRNASADMEVLLINNGCEVDANTHIISQSTHETRFVFQDFEYVTNDEGLDIYCNATFCDAKDYSSDCVQSCFQNPSLIG